MASAPSTKSEWQKIAAEISYSGEAFVGGKSLPALSGSVFDAINPADESIITTLADCDGPDIDLAVREARKSFDSGCWSGLAPSDRKKILLKLAELVEKNRFRLAVTDTLDMGKPISDCLGFDLTSTVDLIEWTAESIDKIYDDIAPSGNDALTLIRREPIGVIGAIVPWNYPLMMAVWKIVPALAAGNSVILKPSEKSSLSALMLAKLAQEAGVPDGVLNVVPGYGHTAGKALALHHDVDVLAFTGSTNVGKQLMQYAGQSNMKRVWLETGGKSPNIVFADCDDLDAAANMAAVGICDNQGETCIATSRLLVENSIKNEFIEQLLAAAAKYKPGDPLDPNTNMGPLVDKNHFDRVSAYIASGLNDGAKRILGGDESYRSGKGYFLPPTIFDETRPDMRIVEEEIFGPVLSIDSFTDWSDAISKANNTRYGLGASLWTSNLSKAHKTANEIKSGMVWVNTWGAGNSTTPFGGVNEKYTDLKTIWIALDDVA